MRHRALNLLTCSVTLLLLAALALPATSILSRPAPLELSSDTDVTRTFGVVVDPWHADEWADAVGAKPQLISKFEAFSRRQTADGFVAEATAKGARELMVTWEPWQPVPVELGREAQVLPQPGYTNRDIARGVQDDYIAAYARSLARFPGTVWIRFAHEMNGNWYPWSRDVRGYRAAWRHVVTVVRRAGADNVRFVWSVNPSLYVTGNRWLAKTRHYWPGSRWVDAVGSTMINWGGRRAYRAAWFLPRLWALHVIYGRRIMITEANTAHGGALGWLTSLRRELRGRRWISALVWSQLPSRGKAHQRGIGDLNWSVTTDPAAAAVLRGIAEDGLARE